MTANPAVVDPRALERAASSASPTLVIGGALALIGAAWWLSRCATCGSKR